MITLKPKDYAITPTKRYQVFPAISTACNDLTRYIVRDTWTKAKLGDYGLKSAAQARARLLNSRGS